MDDAPAFAHASEAELARILDYYEIAWQYEARTFPIQWNLDGKVVESFAPDFYLPDLDLYVELTTLKQSLVRKKNRKLRRLRELYPEVRIKLLYARDFRALMLKYGRLALLDSLTGSEGQMTPPHAGQDAAEGGQAEDPLGTPRLPPAADTRMRSAAPPGASPGSPPTDRPAAHARGARRSRGAAARPVAHA